MNLGRDDALEPSRSPDVRSPDEQTPTIELRHVDLAFGETLVLQDISLTIAHGEIAVIIGGSGAGKTSLVRVILGLVKPTAGQVLIDGTDLNALSERELMALRAKFGMVFQYSALLDSLNVLDNVALPLREHTRLSQKEIEQRVQQLLEELDIAGTELRYPAELSGGMRKRVALARALIRKPQIVIYDEPASGLDPLTARRVDELIQRTRERYGVTSLVISHDMAQALKIADRLYLLDKGRLVAQGPPERLLSDSKGLTARLFEASGVTLPPPPA